MVIPVVIRYGVDIFFVWTHRKEEVEGGQVDECSQSMFFTGKQVQSVSERRIP